MRVYATLTFRGFVFIFYLGVFLASVRGLALDFSQMSLEDLIQFAVQNSPDYLAAKQNIDIARGSARTAGIWPNPILNYQQAFIGGQPGTEGGSTEYAPGLSWELDPVGKRGLRKQAAEEEVKSEHFAFLNFDRLFRKEIRQTYRLYLFHSELLKIKKEFLLQYESLVRTSRLRAETGDISKLEFDRLDLERISYEADLKSAELSFLEASMNMKRLLGVEPSPEPIRLAGSLQFVPLKELGILDEKNVPFKRADYLSLKKREERSSLTTQLKKREAIPSLTLGGEYRKKGPEGYFGLTLSFPIPLLDRNQGEVEKSEAITEKLRLESRGKELEITSEIQFKRVGLKNKEALLQGFLDQGLLEKNKKVAEQSRFAYLKKAYSIVALLENQKNYMKVLLNFYQQIYQYYLLVDDLDAAQRVEVENAS